MQNSNIYGRIIKGIGGLYTVAVDDQKYECTVRGIFRKRGINPTVGDFVDVEPLPDKPAAGTIVEIHQRNNSLIRPRVANVDQAFLVFAVAEPAFNLDLLDRFILTCEHSRIEPVVCFAKTDLLDSRRSESFVELKKVYEHAGYDVVFVSTVENEGIQTIRDMLRGKVSVFAGPSGVGKSSVINAVLKHEQMETGEISTKIKRGKHTTRHAELIQCGPDSFVVDSPGFTTIDLAGITKENLSSYFREFAMYTAGCRFADCQHMNEPECGVKDHVGAEISQARYDRYKTIYNELT